MLPAARSGFTLIELLVVIALIVLLTVLVVPAFNAIRGGTDMTSAAYKIKAVLDQARTYAMANSTYTWVGFFEEDSVITTPAVAGTGRLVMSIVASADGTKIYGTTSGAIDPTKLTQVGKLTKIDGVHLASFQAGNSNGDTWDTRPAPDSTDARIADTSATTNYPFQFPVGNVPAQYTFQKTIQFSPRGEARINSTTAWHVAEIGIVPTHGNVAQTPDSGTGISAVYSGKVAALQLSGFGGNVRIYRK